MVEAMESLEDCLKRLVDDDCGARLVIDAHCDGVICPEHIRREWGDKLLIDFEPDYPYSVTDLGVVALLVFDGNPAHCVFPTDSIRLVVNKKIQMETWWGEDRPVPRRTKAKTRPHLTVIDGGC